MKKRHEHPGEKFPMTRSVAEMRTAFAQMEKNQEAEHAEFIKVRKDFMIRDSTANLGSNYYADPHIATGEL